MEAFQYFFFVILYCSLQNLNPNITHQLKENNFKMISGNLCFLLQNQALLIVKIQNHYQINLQNVLYKQNLKILGKQQKITIIILYNQIWQAQSIMKRTCSTHKDAQYVCISEYCRENCSYLCSLPYDQCKQQHQSCPLISLAYVTKKCLKTLNKQKNLNMKELQKIYEQTKKIVTKLQTFFQQRQSAFKTKELLDPHGLIDLKQKQILINYLKKDKQKQYQSNQQNSFSANWVEKSLINLNIDISSYLKNLMQEKKQFIQEEAIRQSMIKPQALSKMRKSDIQKGSAIDKIRSQSKGPTPVKSQYNELQLQTKNSKISKIVNPGALSNGFQAKISSVIKNHLPIGPLFSNITNNYQTIQTFFYEKFKGANLLYRASENGFLASKFHEKCDGIKNTLTILINEHDKIIGGFTPLPWRTSGDWYQDSSQSSFIFSLTSGQRFPLNDKSKAIWCNHAYGPSFGYPDLQIANKAFYNENSCVNFPQFYNNGNYVHGTGSIQFLCGTKTGHFRIKEWEVFQLEF